MKKRVLVLGGGIAGLSAAFELSKRGIEVDLVEKSCYLGGLAIGFTCKATNKCQQCGACLVEETLRDVVRDPNINIYLKTEVEEVKKNGKFKVKLKKSSAQMAYSKVLKGFSKYNEPYFVSMTHERDVPKDAVNIENLGVNAHIEVDAIILATGFSPFNPILRPTYGYTVWKNIITGLDMEHMLKDNAKVLRPSDGKEAKKVAFIQCVGSRSKEFNTLWCSEVCCPYALRMASLVKHKVPDTDVWVFFIDIQNVGKETKAFLSDIRSKVKFVNAVPIDIFCGENDVIKVYYKDQQENRKFEEFDLVVLSIGITPNLDNKKLAHIIGLEVGDDGFFRSKSYLNPCLASKDGVFLAGTVTGPKNILDSISHAKSAVSETLTYLGGTK